MASPGAIYCNTFAAAICTGTPDADRKFAKKFDAYAGVIFCEVDNGLASGYLYRTNVNPTIGLRFRF